MGSLSDAATYIFYSTLAMYVFLAIMYGIAFMSLASSSFDMTSTASPMIVNLLMVLYFGFTVAFILALYGYVLLYVAIRDYNKVKKVGSPAISILSFFIPIIGYPFLAGILERINGNLKTPAKLLKLTVVLLLIAIILMIPFASVSLGESLEAVLAFAIIEFIFFFGGLISNIIAWGLVYVRAKKLDL
ncbi:MAG: hypothetical protein ACP5GJ_04125 [Nanopusillaceae archaeon]